MTLFELGAGGVEERDDQTLIRGAGAGSVTLVASFERREDAEAAIAALHEALPALAPRFEEVVGDAWRDAWKEHFAPFALTPRITVVPPWTAPRPAAPERGFILELEPGRAFGTGLHASTALICGILDERSADIEGREVLDVGTGSGILALAALLYGASHAVAIDIDPDVIQVVNENAARNGMTSRIEARAGTVKDLTSTYPWVLANIEARVLGPIAGDLTRAVAPGGTLVLSGILEAEHDDMVRRYTSVPARLEHIATRRAADASSGWVSIAFSRSS